MLRKIMIALLVPAMLYSVASALTLDELIAKNIKSRGGIEKIRGVKTMKLNGTLMVQGMEIPATLTFKRPNMVRSESQVQGMTMLQGFDGTTAWMISPLTGNPDPQKLSDEDARDIEEQSDVDGAFIDAKKKGNTLELIGQEDVDSVPTYKLKVTLKNGNVRNYFLNARTGLEVLETSMRKVQAQEIEVFTYYSDYKPVNGLMMAYGIENKVKGQSVSRIVLNKIELNIPLADSLFKMPAKAATVADSTANALFKTEGKPDSTKK